MGEILLRMVLGGAVVSALAAVGQVWKPKTFAGLFGSAPSVALVTTGMGFATKGAPYVATEARAMIAGAIGFVAYGMACVAIARWRGVPVWFGAGAGWVVWGAAAFGGTMLLHWIDLA